MLNRPRYIDPLSDFGFKFLFGSAANKELLISLLNSIFRGKKNIKDLVFNKTEFVGETEQLGAVVFDLSCIGSNDEKFVIEVQSTSHVNFKKRMLYYGCKLITDQAPKGRRQHWNYAISEVYIIALLANFSISNSNNVGDWLNYIRLFNSDSGSVFDEDFVFIYIELVNFTKGVEALENDLDRWMYILKHLPYLTDQPINTPGSVFEKLFNIAEYSKLNMEEKEMYDVSLKRLWDQEVVRQYYEQKMEEALQNGIEKGVEKGREEALEAAQRETKSNLLNIARNMKKAGSSIDFIVEITKLSIDEVTSL